MAVIYLKHDVHGAKVACSEQEAVYDEGFGWVRFTVAHPVAAPAPMVPEPVDEVPQVVSYVVTAENGMQPDNAMPKPRRRRSTVE